MQKEYIIEESTKLFLKHGLKAIRMDDIAARLGVSKRTIYEMFGDRENLIQVCLKDYYDRMQAENDIRTAKAENVVEEFFLLIDDWEGQMHQDMHLVNELRRFYPGIYTKLSEERYKEGMSRLKERLRQGVEKGLFLPGINFEFVAIVLADAIYNVMMRPDSYASSNVSVTDALKYITMYFFRGIATAKGIRLIDGLLKTRYNNFCMNGNEVKLK